MIRRTLTGLVVAGLLAVALTAVALPSICESLEPDTFWHWFFKCDGPAGGGSSGAGMR